MKPLPAWLVIRKIEKEALGTPREMMTEVDHETKDFKGSIGGIIQGICRYLARKWIIGGG